MRFLFILFLENNVAAADTCCVDEDIAAAFLLHETYSRDWPSDFPLRVDIEGFEFIGSSQYTQASIQSVAWRTELNPQSSRDLVTEAILADDWLPMPRVDRMRINQERGFIPHQRRAIEDNQQFCRGRDGTLSVRARQSTVGTVVTLTHSDQNRARDCAAHMAAREIHQIHGAGIMNYLPTLMLPESIEAHSGSGTGGGGDEARADMSVTTALSAAEVSFYFEPQMKEQQWTLESDFQGSKTSGHLWRRTVDGLELTCIVTAIESGNGLRLRMHVEAL